MEDLWIQVDSSKRIRVEGEFSGKEVGLIERWMMSVKEGFYGGGSSLVRAEDPFIHVTNITSTRIRVQWGDIMGILRDPETYLDKSSQECETQQKAFVLLAQKLVRGSASEKEELSKPLLSPDQLNEEGTTEDANGEGGPKTVEAPVMETLPSSWLEELIDILPDTPKEIQEKTFHLISKPSVLTTG